MRAPTGQICTVFPLKYEVKTWSSKTLTSMASPRPRKSIWASPAISSRETHAAAALDAPLAIEQDELGDRDGLGPVALLLQEPALAGPVGEHLVLQRALPALVAHGAVERMVDEEELEHPVLRLLDLLRGGVDHHAVGHGHVAGRLQRGAARARHLDQTHAAHAHRLHAGVVAEARDERPGLLGRGDQELAGRGGDLPAVDGEGDRGAGVGLGGDAVV